MCPEHVLSAPTWCVSRVVSQVRGRTHHEYWTWCVCVRGLRSVGEVTMNIGCSVCVCGGGYLRSTGELTMNTGHFVCVCGGGSQVCGRAHHRYWQMKKNKAISCGKVQ